MKNLIITVLAGIVIFMSVALLYMNIREVTVGIENIGDTSTARSRAWAAEKADKKGTSNIVIGIVFDNKYDADSSLLNGLETARDQINENGGLWGRKIEFIEKSNSGTGMGSKNAVQELASNKKIIAIIGGNDYSYLIPISPLCEFNGIPLISPVLPSGLVPYPEHGKFVFTSYPNAREEIKTMYDFLLANNLKSTVIMSPPEFSYGYYFANAFDRYLARSATGKTGVIYRQILYSNINPEVSMKLFKSVYAFDNVLIAGEIPMIGYVIELFKRSGESSVFMVSDEAETSSFAKLDACKGVKIYFPSIYDPDSEKSTVKDFKEYYKKKYGILPDVWAAQGYDTLNMLAAAMKEAKSTVPEKIAEALHKIKFTGNVSTLEYISFNQEGEIGASKFVIKYLENGEFKVLRNLKIPPGDVKGAVKK
jgi:branched-chain amino acid transport system substrate-binding protein